MKGGMQFKKLLNNKHETPRLAGSPALYYVIYYWYVLGYCQNRL